MSKFKFIVDTRRFCVRSIVNGNKAEPVATIRKADGGAILIFFADEVAAELKRWRPQAVVKKSGTTGRYYNTYPKGLPDSGFAYEAGCREKECDLCKGQGYTKEEYVPKMVQDGWEVKK